MRSRLSVTTVQKVLLTDLVTLPFGGMVQSHLFSCFMTVVSLLDQFLEFGSWYLQDVLLEVMFSRVLVTL